MMLYPIISWINPFVFTNSRVSWALAISNVLKLSGKKQVTLMHWSFLITRICTFSSTDSTRISHIFCNVQLVGSQSKTKTADSHLRREGVLVTLNISSRQRKVLFLDKLLNSIFVCWYIWLCFFDTKSFHNALQTTNINQCTMISHSS